MSRRKHFPIIGTKYGQYYVVSLEIAKSTDNKTMFEVMCGCGKKEFVRAWSLESGRSTSCKSCASKRTALHYPPPVNFLGIGEFSKTHFSSIKHGAKVRGISFDVSIEYLYELFISQNKKCALSGVEITLSKSIKNSNVNWDIITASLDRIDNNLGYIEGNVWWVHKEVNKLKHTFTVDRLKYWCKLIAENDTLLLQQKEV